MPGHKDIEGNKLADKQVREAVVEMLGVDPKDYPFTLDKREAMTEIKKNLKVKWKQKFDLSEKVNQIQEVFTEVGCRNCCGENDRQIFSAVNQLLTQYSSLNSQKAKIDPKVSNLCSACHVPEDRYHYIFTCDLFKNERDTLQSTVEDILNRDALNSVSDINMKTLNGIVDKIGKQAQNDILSALHQFVKSTNRKAFKCYACT